MKRIVAFLVLFLHSLFSDGQPNRTYLVGLSTKVKPKFYSFEEDDFFSLLFLSSLQLNIKSNDSVSIKKQIFYMLFANHNSSWNLLSCYETDTSEIAWTMRFQSLKEKLGSESVSKLGTIYDSLFLKLQSSLRKLYSKHSKFIRIRTLQITIQFIPVDIEMHACIFNYYNGEVQVEAVIRKIIKPYHIQKKEREFLRKYGSDLLKNQKILELSKTKNNM